MFGNNRRDPLCTVGYIIHMSLFMDLQQLQVEMWNTCEQLELFAYNQLQDNQQSQRFQPWLKLCHWDTRTFSQQWDEMFYDNFKLLLSSGGKWRSKYPKRQMREEQLIKDLKE